MVRHGGLQSSVVDLQQNEIITVIINIVQFPTDV